MQAQEIEHYLAEPGAALQDQGIVKPVRLLLIGGAYMMLLAKAPRTTDDVDIFWIEEGEDFQKARLALRDAVQTIASRYALPLNWFNYLTQMLIYDKLPCREANYGDDTVRCTCMPLPRSTCSR